MHFSIMVNVFRLMATLRRNDYCESICFYQASNSNDKPLVLKDENGELWEVGYIDQFPDYSGTDDL